MRIPVGRRITTRRSTAMICWGAVVGVTWMLAQSRRAGLSGVNQWEPAAILLSAFVALLSLFSWLLFFARRASADESPALFFSGLLTLVPPAVLAWHLLPPESGLRGWMALCILVFGVFAMLSPIPVELFRIPRDRRSYAQLQTDSTLARLDAPVPDVSFERISMPTVFRLTAADVSRESRSDQGQSKPGTDDAAPRDPWGDPFAGTGRRLSQVRPVTRPQPAAGVPLPQSLRERFPDRSVPMADHSPADHSPADHSPAGSRAADVTPTGKPVAPREQLIGGDSTPLSADLRALDRMLQKSFEESVDEAESAPGNAVADPVWVQPENLQLDRVRDEFGGEQIMGTVIAEFAEGQKRAHLHISFVPPLESIPEVEAEPAGDDPLRLKVAMRQPYGIRIEVRRAIASTALRAEIGFSATAVPKRQPRAE